MVPRLLRTLLVSAAIALAAPGCDVNKYGLCPNCDPGQEDGGGTGNDANVTVDANPNIDARNNDACVSSGTEVCDGIDNDCDGNIDEGSLPGIGVTCSNNMGECVEGVTECTGGEITCSGVLPTIEVCDDKDNDCNGLVDDGNPEGNVPCGISEGECQTGLTECQAGGNLACVGNVDPMPETCDGKDNDCDTKFDEDDTTGGPLTGGACDPHGFGNTGQCSEGTNTCLGGVMQCVGAVYPEPEQCDGDPDLLDRNCNGDPLLPEFDLQSNRLHCGACNNDCSANFTVATPNVNAVTCSSGLCTIPPGGCAPGFHDINGIFEDGCEYACVIQSTQEACNLQDDDCDGNIDENLVPPDICSPNGECANPTVLTPTCTATGWRCDYATFRPGVEVDAMGNIVPETLCDGLDNDCDTGVDEGDPLKNQACDDGGIGVCKGTGTYQCVAGNPSAPVECNITTPGQAPGLETCNNLDDDCDNTVDEDPDMGELTQWVDIGGGVEIFAYEASRPAATDTGSGSNEPNPSGKACSEPNRRPWTSVTYAQAQAACAALGGGARLCTEAEWERACRGPIPSPVEQQSGGDQLVVIEAENFDANVNGTSDDTWVFRTTDAGFSGTGYMSTEVNNNGTDTDRGEAITQSPRLDFDVNFTFAGTNVVHRVCMRAWAPNTSGNRAHAGINGAIPASADDFGNFSTGAWTWQCTDNGGTNRTITVPSAGLHTISIWMREDGIRVDKLILTTNLSYTPSGKGPPVGCDWSYETNCATYEPNTCNGNDFDTDGNPGNGDQDEILTTGAMAACFTDWTGGNRVHDLSGNVKEWTEARAAGINPIRGGASNNTEVGISCGFDFTAADDVFFFPNVGFRCCR